MNITLTLHMKLNALILSLLAPICVAFAAADPGPLYVSLEQRLQALKSLEIQYQAAGSAGDNVVEGRMIWIKPDRFYHDTPEWTVCQTGDEQWRYLKKQNTLIREAASEQSEYSPQNVLFNLEKNFRATGLDEAPDGHRILKLETLKKDEPGGISIEFPRHKSIPDALTFVQPDGSTVRYVVTRWDENVKPDPSLFAPPAVPAENLIDFRAAGKGK
jgi:outer membrane lipoprotein-sorting protein